ncbi:sensor histidine kinase [Roseicella aquatilis]|uniref:histidine kinase n=1 Tax=Roseicella aquatilis TaxID=2527868 RepID=A0A4R4DFQ0_9PROT|nr:histidine kinase dimerization/phosphoacceptor domain -containing protein [Roseicella aquatilis]TCZ58743.1 GAF domain-containing protein [Roseicella aquatilis]
MPNRVPRSGDRLLAQQTALARFGELALRSEDLQEILHDACRLAAEGLGTGLAKVLELQPDGRSLLVRAGVGWEPGVVGQVTLQADPGTLEGLALAAPEPILSEDTEQEARFGIAPFMRQHGVRSLVNVIVLGADGKPPYGLLEVESREPRSYDRDEIAFLQSYANMLAAAVERLRTGDELRARAVEVERLFRELQHRVKNNLQVIIGLIQLQARRATSAETQEALRVVRRRVDALRLLHDKLYLARDVDRVDLGAYLGELAGTLLRFHADDDRQVRLVLEMRPMIIVPEQAAPLGLIVNEFITNSLKYAFDGTKGTVSLKLEPARGGELRVTLCDDGRGLPQERSDGTGMRLMDGLARQLSARLDWASVGHGTRLTILFRPLPVR